MPSGSSILTANHKHVRPIGPSRRSAKKVYVRAPLPLEGWLSKLNRVGGWSLSPLRGRPAICLRHLPAIAVGVNEALVIPPHLQLCNDRRWAFAVGQESVAANPKRMYGHDAGRLAGVPRGLAALAPANRHKLQLKATDGQ